MLVELGVNVVSVCLLARSSERPMVKIQREYGNGEGDSVPDSARGFHASA